jgi:hypothetical protein
MAPVQVMLTNSVEFAKGPPPGPPFAPGRPPSALPPPPLNALDEWTPATKAMMDNTFVVGKYMLLLLWLVFCTCVAFRYLLNFVRSVLASFFGVWLSHDRRITFCFAWKWNPHYSCWKA